MTAEELETKVRKFVESEQWLLDDGQLLDWLDLFDNPCSYWIPVNPAQVRPGLAPALVDESRLALEARVRRLLDPHIAPQTPASRTCRFLGSLRCSVQGELVHARSKFMVVESRAAHHVHDPQRVFAGEASYSLVPSNGSFKIRQKRVDLINSEAGLLGVSVLL